MPAAVSEDTSSIKVDRSEQMRNVLKIHILRERVRKRQELEAKVEEERLRKEREAREQQDVMTLGETREQISQLEAKLTELKDEKHQLFLQLKKVLNEDDNRRRQLLKENSEVILAQPPDAMLNVVTLMHQQQQQQQQQMYHNAVPQIQTKATVKQYKAPVKRPRSPSPQPVIPISLYHQGYRYKTPSDYAPQNPPPPPPKDDGRRNELVRAVLWNKAAPQYNNQPIAFYPLPPQELSNYYPMPTREQSRNVYEPPRPQTFHIDQKMHDHYAMRTQQSHAPVIHGGPIPISAVQSASKTGSITAGYPVRSQPQYQPGPPSSSAYTAHIRSFGQPPGAPLNHPQRD